MIELGIYTFGDLVADPHTGRTVSGRERMRQMLEMAKLADDTGLDIIGSRSGSCAEHSRHNAERVCSGPLSEIDLQAKASSAGLSFNIRQAASAMRLAKSKAVSLSLT